MTSSNGSAAAASAPPMDRWMAACAERIEKTLLKDLRIPGTHDSFTAAIQTELVDGWMTCQCTTVTQQLNMGVRYFDCRLQSIEGTLWTYHGLDSNAFDPILTAVRDFLDAPGHEREIVILDMSHFEYFSANDGPCLAYTVAQLFGDKLIPPTIDLQTTTVADVWATSGRVVALFEAPNQPGIALTPVGNGKGPNPFDVCFAYTLDDQCWLYSCNNQTQAWSLQSLSTDGVVSSPTDSGTWPAVFAVQFPFTVDGSHYMYAFDVATQQWFVRQFEAGGQMGTETDHGTWGGAFSVQFPFAVDGASYFLGFNPIERSWFIQQLLAGGKMGSQTDRGQWANPYAVQFPFQIKNRTFFMGFDTDGSNFWFIQELLPGGKMGGQTDCGNWLNCYEMQFPVNLNGVQCFVGIDKTWNYWFIQELLEGGQMGAELLNGYLPPSVAVAVANHVHPYPIIVQQEANQWLPRAIREVDAKNLWCQPCRNSMFATFWTNQDSLQSLIAANQVVLAESAPLFASDKLFVLQCQITPPVSTFLDWLIINDMETLQQFAKQVNAYYKEYLQTVDPAITRINIVIADFVDEDYCRAVIAPYTAPTSSTSLPPEPPASSS
jgi:hypothetical protein